MSYVKLCRTVLLLHSSQALVVWALNVSNSDETPIMPRQLLADPISARSALCKNVTVSEHDVAKEFFGLHKNWVRPLKNAAKPMSVEVRLVLSTINDIIERSKIIKLSGYLLFYWYDEFHVWNNSFPHACVPSLTMPASEIWIPEIAMINSEQHYELLLMYGEEKVRVSSNGYISYRPGGTFQAFCDFDLRLFPFDSQNCTLILESWRYTVEFQIFHLGDAVQKRWWIENEQWSLISTDQRLRRVQYVIPTNTFSRVEFDLVLQRKIGYYLINVIIPSLIISVAEIAAFAAQVDESMKLELSFTCLLAYGVFQLMIIGDIPRTSDRIPLLCYYIDLSMFYICMAMLGEGLVFICFRKAKDQRRQQRVPDLIYRVACVVSLAFGVKKPRPPRDIRAEDEERHKFMKHLTENYISQFPNDQEKSEYHDQQLFALEAEKKQLERDAEVFRVQQWEFLGDICDRFCLFGYCFFIFITPVFLFVIVPRYETLFYKS